MIELDAPLLGPSPSAPWQSSVQRVVVKVGSRSLVGEAAARALMSGAADQGKAPSQVEVGPAFAALASDINNLNTSGRSVVLVSSGAVALGRARLGIDTKPKTIAEMQACASVGQSLLMAQWERAFGGSGMPVAQMLLSHADLEDRARYLNARAALDSLIGLDAVPIINENDSVAVDELRFGDNDQLAAMVCTLAHADLLVLLTDVEGLLDSEGKRVPRVEDLADALAHVSETRAGGIRSLGSGGMASKLQAAQRASRRGIYVVIADAREDQILSKILSGEHDVGTLVVPTGGRMRSRKHWIAYTLLPRGDLIVDSGAVEAVRVQGRSLLPAGLVGVRGHFKAGDAVRLRDIGGQEFGRGLARYNTEDMAKLAGAGSEEIQQRLGYHGGDELVHRDDLAISSVG